MSELIRRDDGGLRDRCWRRPRRLRRLCSSRVVPDIAGHLIAASVMSAPAALVIAKVMWPETEPSERPGPRSRSRSTDRTSISSTRRRGVLPRGMKLASTSALMLIAFIALIALGERALGLPRSMLYNELGSGSKVASAVEPWTIQRILGWLFWPFAFLIGVPVAECAAVGTSPRREARAHRVHRIPPSCTRLSSEGSVSPTLTPHGRHRELRPLWLRELRFHRNSTWRYRRNRAGAPPRSRSTRCFARCSAECSHR